MKKQNYELNKNFMNFMYHALSEKLSSSLSESIYAERKNIIDERVPMVLGDFFEQFLGIDRNEALQESYKDLSHLLNKDFDLSDPVLTSILYHAKLADICGDENEDFDEIYKPQFSN